MLTQTNKVFAWGRGVASDLPCGDTEVVSYLPSQLCSVETASKYLLVSAESSFKKQVHLNSTMKLGSVLQSLKEESFMDGLEINDLKSSKLI